VSGSRATVTEPEARRIFVNQLDLLSSDEFDAARDLARRLRIPLERAISDRGRIPLRFLFEQLATTWGVRYTDLAISTVQPHALAKVPEDVARRYGVVPFRIEGQRLSMAMADPRDDKVRRDLQRLTQLEIIPHLAQDADIQRALLLYRAELRGLMDRAEGSSAAGDGELAPTAVLDQLLQYAAVTGASDIHVEPFETETLIRCRVDGVLRDVMSLPPAIAQPLAARIKAISAMRIDERRSPQDGRFTHGAGGVRLDLRVSSLPTHWGEKVVMRVLPNSAMALDLETLGLSEQDYAVVLRNVSRPFGMVLVTGPTGSGKSTTLYAMLTRIGAENRNVLNISTIEDPVEHPLPRVTQVSANPAAGIDFAAGLRALLRQDPDVIMVGEIRDRETAEVAVRSALVGRLLLSTLHTNDTASAIPRLIDMGIEPFLLSSTLSTVIAQRLVRRICPACRESTPIDAAGTAMLRGRPDLDEALHELQAHGAGDSADDLERIRVFRGRGCRACDGTGYRGRIGLFEVLEMNDELRRLALSRTDAATIRIAAIASGMRTMFRNGLAKVLLGETTIEELMRVSA
jgi:type IV pilus assembly protein PilB